MSAAHVVTYVVSSELMKCRFLKSSSDHPTNVWLPPAPPGRTPAGRFSWSRRIKSGKVIVIVMYSIAYHNIPWMFGSLRHLQAAHRQAPQGARHGRTGAGGRGRLRSSDPKLQWVQLAGFLCRSVATPWQLPTLSVLTSQRCLWNKHSFCGSLCLTILQQKLLSRPWLGALKAYLAKSPSSMQECFFHRHR